MTAKAYMSPLAIPMRFSRYPNQKKTDRRRGKHIQLHIILLTPVAARRPGFSFSD